MPAKLLLQLTTAFQEGGLRDRSGTFFYKDHISKIDVPVLAIAGDLDIICPPEAVYGIITKTLISFSCFILYTWYRVNQCESIFVLGLMKTETVKLVPKHLAMYKVFGEPGGPHYAHYDLVGGRLVCSYVLFFFFSLSNCYLLF